MELFKRSQIEDAISRVAAPDGWSAADIASRVKRMLEADRADRRSARANDPERANYAFYSTEAEGTGVDVGFSGYEAFALLLGLRMLYHGWPQGLALKVLRRARKRLQAEHTRILALKPKVLFDRDRVREQAQPGAMAVSNTDPVFLAIFSDTRSEKDGDSTLSAVQIFRGEADYMKFLRQKVQTSTIFELATSAHDLAFQLSQTQPRKRGRK